MTDFRVVLNAGGVQQLLQSPAVLAELERRAEAIATAAGPGFAADSEIGRVRARASVHTTDVDGMLAEARDHALTRSIDAGR